MMGVTTNNGADEMTKYYNEMEQTWRKLKQDHPEVAKAIEESDKRQFLDPENGTWEEDHDEYVEGDGFVFRAPIPEPVKLDTRRVAGWWCIDERRDKGFMRLITSVGVEGSEDVMPQCTFSKDPMRPLDQWQTLIEICAEAER